MSIIFPRRKVILVIIGGVFLSGLAAWWIITVAAPAKSRELVTAAAGEKNSAKRQFDLVIAHDLDGGNIQAASALAGTYFASRQYQRVLATIGKGQAPELLRWRAKALAELDQTSVAVTAADQLAGQTKASDDQLLDVLVNLLAGRRLQADQIISHMTHSEALQRAHLAESTSTSFGLELYNVGLPDSAERVLQSELSSAERDTVLGNINLARADQASLIKARDYFTSALAAKPDDIPARQQLIAALKSLGQTSEAARQARLLSNLQAGRP